MCLADQATQPPHCPASPERAPAFEIVTPGLVAGDKVPLVGFDLAGEPACHRPDGTCIECIQQDRMGHQAGNPPVAVDEWVYPQQAIMA